MAISNLSSSVCLAPACERFSNLLRGTMHQNFEELDPCENWDQYVCDGFRHKNTVPPGHTRFSPLDMATMQINNLVQGILTGSYSNLTVTVSNTTNLTSTEQRSADKENFGLVQTYYQSCLNNENLPQYTDLALMRLLTELFPFLNTQNYNNWTEANVEASLIKVSELGASALVDIYPAVSMIDHKTPKVIIQPHFELGLPYMDNYKDQVVRLRYMNAIKTFFMFTSGSTYIQSSVSDLDSLVTAIVDLEEKLAAALPSKQALRETEGNVRALNITAGMQQLYGLPLPQVIRPHFESNSTANIFAEILFPVHVSKAAKLISAEPVKTRLAFMQWQVWVQTEPLWDVRWKTNWVQILKDLQGRSEDDSIEARCAAQAMNHFGYIIDSFYTRKHVSQKKTAIAQEIVNNVRDEFVDMLEKTPYLNQTKGAFVKKAKQTTSSIGYTTTLQNPNIMDPLSMAAYYKGVQVLDAQNTSREHGFMDNYLLLEKWNTANRWKSMRDSLKEGKSNWHATTVNAFYSPWNNRVTFPAGILSLFSFDEELPPFAHYAGFGGIAGHEIAHAFDDQWGKYDANGTLIDSWSLHEKTTIEDNIGCFMRSYQEVKVLATHGRQMGLDIRYILGEAIADSVGLDVAYETWKKNYADKSPMTLPNMGDLTVEQLFWIVRTAEWCSVDKLESIEGQAQDVHAPGKVRTWKPLEMTRGWNEAFKCRKGPECTMFGPDGGKT